MSNENLKMQPPAPQPPADSEELWQFYEEYEFPSKAVEALHNALAFFARDVFYAFDVKGTYPSLVGEVSRIEDYVTRSVAMLAGFANKNQIIVSKNKAIQDLLSFYQEAFNLSPEEFSVLEVSDPFSKEAILRAVKTAGLSEKEEILNFILDRMQFFGYSEEIFANIKSALLELGVDPGEFEQALEGRGIKKDSLNVTSFESPSHKLLFRRNLADFEGGGKRFNLDFIKASKLFDTFQKEAVPKWLRDKKLVFVKRADLASGAGIKKFSVSDNKGISELKSYFFALRQENIDLANVLVEEAAELGPNSKEGSLQFYIMANVEDDLEKDTEDNSEKNATDNFVVKYLGITEQIIEGNEHQGNIVSFSKGFADSLISESDIEKIQAFVLKLAKETGYQGYISLDFIVDKFGAPKLLEANARITGATAPLAVATYEQITRLEDSIFVASRNTIELSPGAEIDAKKLLEILRESDLLYTKEKQVGLIPALIALPEKIGFIAVAKSMGKALEYIEQAMKELPVKKDRV